MDKKVKGLIILAAFLSFLLSVYLWFSGQKDEGLFVGIWVPSILVRDALALGKRFKSMMTEFHIFIFGCVVVAVINFGIVLDYMNRYR